ncbi:MAG: hypothetical protein J0626_01895, partial [Rhodospirillaceae bacterium]|nr:hypothetical protein [Rhodospirillaceae bacterium]
MEARFGKRELRSLLPEDTAEALYEIMSNGVLEKSGDSAYPYRVEKHRLVYGLGMLLASDLSRASVGYADVIQEWFEPQRDMDIKTEILGAAVFFSLPTYFPSYPAPQRRALLRAWLISRNMPPEQEAAIAAYLPDCAEDLLAESDGFFVPSDDPIGNAQVRFGKALATRRQDARVLPFLQCAAERWAGRFIDDRTKWSFRLTDEPLDDWISSHLPTMIAVGGVGHVLLRDAIGARRIRDNAGYRESVARVTGEGHFVDGMIDESIVELSLNPQATVAGVWEAQVRERLAALPVADFISSRSPTVIDHDFEWLSPIAAALAPDALGGFLRSVLTSLPDRKDENLCCICLYLPEMVAAAGREEFDSIGAVQRAMAASPAKDGRGSECRAFLALAMDLPVGALVDLFLDRPSDFYDPWQLHHWFSLQSPELSQAIHARLTIEVAPRRLERLLFVASCAPRPLTPEQRDVIVRCLMDGNDHRRYAAIVYTLNSADEGLIATLLADSRSLVGEGGSQADRMQAQILAQHGDQVPFTDIVRRLPLPDLAVAVRARGNDPAEVDALADYLDAVLFLLREDGASPPEQVTTKFFVKTSCLGGVFINVYSERDSMRQRIELDSPEATSLLKRIFSKDDDYDALAEAEAMVSRLQFFQAAGKQLNDGRFSLSALRAIRTRHPDKVTAWAESALGSSTEAKRLRMLGSAFFQSLAAALVRDDPVLGFRLWRVLRDEGVSLTFKLSNAGTDWMACLPFQAP